MNLSARSLSCGIATVAVLGLGLSLVVAGPAQAAPSGPSWDDVKAAKSDAADAQQTVDELSSRLTSLQEAADRAGVVEQQAGQAYAMAVSQQQQAQDTLDDLAAQSKRAKAKADDSAGQVAGLVVELSRTGGGDLSTAMLVDGSDSEDLLYRVGTMSHLSERSATVLAEARADQNTVDSLADQQDAATTALRAATKTSESALTTANDVSADAQARVQEQQEQQDEVLRQLAYLKGTSVATETAYWTAQQAKAAEIALAAQTARDDDGDGRATGTRPGASTGSSDPSTSTPSTGTPSTSTPANPAPAQPAPSKPSKPKPAKPAPANPAPAPAPAPSKPKPAPAPAPAPTPTVPSGPSKAAGAIAYARAQLGKPYVLNGAGPNTWDCSGLVMMAYGSQGIPTGGHNVVWQYNHFASIGRLVPLSQRQPGDILFYSHTGTASGGYHDSIYTGNGMMVEAARPGVGVVERAVWLPNELLPYVARPSGSL